MGVLNATDSESCRKSDFNIHVLEPLGSATRELVRRMYGKEISCEDRRWIELAQDNVQCRV